MEACVADCEGAAGGLTTTCLDACYFAAGWSEPSSSGGSTDTTVSILIACVLLVLSGLFSGLTLGLMSLDMVGLEIIADGGEPEEREYAKKIMPVRRHGNLLLCTLLLGNTLVNSMVSILLADLTSGAVGVAVSTLSIVVLGEILPQAACSRHGLRIGAATIWIVKVFMAVLFPVAWPISLLLDKLLGRDIGNVFSADELKKLITIHVENPDAQTESGLTKDEHTLIIGALEFKDRTVSDVMTSLDVVYMLEDTARLDFQTLYDIYRSGFTRIPVYQGNRPNIVGILFTKDLILIDPDDEVEVKTILSFHGDKSGGYVKHVPDDTKLDAVFREFKRSCIHLLIATRPVADAVAASGAVRKSFSVEGLENGSATAEVTGIVTLEDVLEEVIQDEIVDESDRFVDVNMPHDEANEVGRLTRRVGGRADPTAYLQMFEHKLREKTKLAQNEVLAIVAFLSINVPEFKKIAAQEALLSGLVRRGQVLEESDDFAGDDMSHGSRKYMLGPEPEQAQLGKCLYQRGKRADYFILLLQGKVIVHAGVEGFEADIGPWSVLGQGALTNALTPAPGGGYVPDFSAWTTGDCRLLKITGVEYAAAVRAAQMTLVAGSRAVRAEARAESIGDEGSRGRTHSDANSEMVSGKSSPEQEASRRPRSKSGGDAALASDSVAVDVGDETAS